MVPHPRGQPGYAFRLNGSPTSTLFFPPPEILGVLELVVPDEALWASARIRVLPEEWRQKRVPIFGPSFSAALRAAVSKGLVKSRFSLLDSDRVKGTGLAAHLIVHLAHVGVQQGLSMLKVEAWEPLGTDGEAFYVHGVFGTDSHGFTHLDGAVIWFAAEDLNRLVNDGKKLKGLEYQKQFRLDGDLSADVAFEIIRRFVPISELVDEYLVDVAP